MHHKDYMPDCKLGRAEACLWLAFIVTYIVSVLLLLGVTAMVAMLKTSFVMKTSTILWLS